MASKGTQKGNRGQRKAIQCLKKWARKKFKSTSQSGMPGYNHDPHKGDILCDTEGFYFPFSIEVKNYREIDFSHLLVPGIKNILILDFWKQCLFDANSQKKIPMLMMRYDRLPSDFFFIVVDYQFFEFCIFPFFSKNQKALIYNNAEYNLAIIPSNWLFDIPYKRLHKIFKNYNKNLEERIKKLPIDGFDFSISNRGYLINNLNKRKIFGSINGHGCKIAVLHQGSNRKTITVYRWVANVFVKKPIEAQCVNHIKPDRSITDARNLEWITYRGNTQHFFDNVQYHYRILKLDKITGECLGEYNSPILAARSVGKKSGSTIVKSILGKRKTAYGFIWKKISL